MKKLLMAALACALPQATLADETPAQPTQTIEDLFNKVLKDGLQDGTVRPAESRAPFVTGIKLQTPGQSDHRMRPVKTLLFTFKIPLFGSEKKAVPTLSEFKQGVEQTCTAQGGTLRFFKDTYTYAGSASASIRSEAIQLERNQLYGDFVCVAGDRTLYQVKVYPNNDNTDGLKWNIFAMLLDRGQFESAEKTAKANAEAAVDFISTLKPGMEAAIPASLVPERVTAEMGYADLMGLSERKYMLCALVIDVKPALVQVQVGRTTLYVSSTNVSPVKKRYTPGKYPLGSWTEWCF